MFLFCSTASRSPNGVSMDAVGLDLLGFVGQRRFATLLADPPWQFTNKTGTVAPGRRQVNLLATRKREHSRKPDEQYGIIEGCSSAPYLELFARGTRKGWTTWGNQADAGYRPTWKTYAHHSQVYPVAAE